MATRDRYGAARKKKKRSALFAPLSFLLVLVAFVFGVGVFFRVQTIEVTGLETYTADEIIEASGIDVGDNLFFIDRASASSRIYSRLSQVEDANVEPVLPNKLIIRVRESSAVAYVDWMGTYWVVTGNCKMLKSATPDELTGTLPR